MVGSSSSPFYILRPRALRVLRALGDQHLFSSSLVLLPQAPLDHTTRAIMAITHTSSNTTLPGEPGMIGRVPPDSRRSTLDIILSCLSIFLFCSWKCVHLNIPSLAYNRFVGDSHFPEDTAPSENRPPGDVDVHRVYCPRTRCRRSGEAVGGGTAFTVPLREESTQWFHSTCPSGSQSTS